MHGNTTQDTVYSWVEMGTGHVCLEVEGGWGIPYSEISQ
jgi:hypothetical protein